MGVALRKGFADPVFDSQRVFRAVMNAMARPGSIVDLDVALEPPSPLTAELAAVVLALADPEAPVWLDPILLADDDVTSFLRFHTGAVITSDPQLAAFALVSRPDQLPPLHAFAPGTPAFPDRSTTIVLAAGSLSNQGGLRLRGPGIENDANLNVDPIPPDFASQWAANHEIFPCGVDLVFVANGAAAAMTRTTEIVGRA